MASYSLPQTLTLAQASDVLAQARAAGGAVNAAALQVFDTSALAVLLELRRSAASGAWRIEQAPPKLVQLAQLYGVDGLLGLAPVPVGAPP